ncbi:hypothetical protein GTN31_04950 [Macrococcoides canis]|uniref:hypothetical protein n=1 Tax=Macrococcoides canis TaxID=1855823 RepID=UPI0013E9386F|nr:hypothetical protein [Macrococcus canis]QIH75697.1 hypothetical protein GTN31_04950 [Macrococcus canis]
MKNEFIIIIVEGVTDELLVGELIEDFKERHPNVTTHIVDGDLFFRNINSNKSIKALVGDFVKQTVIPETKIKLKDISAVIQIVDIDGVYINCNQIIINSDLTKLTYHSDKIEVCNEGEKNYILNRNKIRSRNINSVVNGKVLKDKPYKLFFHSCNLEHVLFDELNYNEENKYDDVNAKILTSNPEELLKLLIENSSINPDFDFNENYKNTWNEIKSNTNEISRSNNVALMPDFLEELLKNDD